MLRNYHTFSESDCEQSGCGLMAWASTAAAGSKSACCNAILSLASEKHKWAAVEQRLGEALALV